MRGEGGALPAGGAACAWIDAGHLLGEGIRLFFADRNGGCSPPPFHTLNLAYHTGDEAANVDANRRLAAAAMGIEAGRVFYPRQVHGLEVVRVEAVGAPLRDPPPGADERGEDGAYTTEPGIALAVLTADCVPLALASPGRGAVSMLHAGWKGTIGDIAGGAVRMLERELGATPGECLAVMGPCIGPCCYGVDEGRARLFVEEYGEESGVVTEDGGYRLDLRRANRLNLARAGLEEGHIFAVGGCTCCDGRYFSFRREGRTGRQGSFVFIEVPREG